MTKTLRPPVNHSAVYNSVVYHPAVDNPVVYNPAVCNAVGYHPVVYHPDVRNHHKQHDQLGVQCIRGCTHGCDLPQLNTACM